MSGNSKKDNINSRLQERFNDQANHQYGVSQKKSDLYYSYAMTFFNERKYVEAINAAYNAKHECINEGSDFTKVQEFINTVTLLTKR